MTTARFFTAFIFVCAALLAPLPANAASGAAPVQAEADAAAVDAKPGFLDFFFPFLRRYKEDPSVTLRAPFAPPETDGVGSALPLERQHRLNEDIAAWVNLIVPELLNFKRETYAQELQKTEIYFGPEGRAQYMAFLKSFDILQALESGQYSTGGFVQSAPAILTQDVVGGRYSWLLRVPVTVSYFEGGARSYKDMRVRNQSLQITLQVGRRENVPDPGVAIDRWEAQQN